MSDNNLPEINFKKKEKEKKGGFVGWLRNKLGFGSNGSMGSAGVNAGGGAMNAGRTIGQGALNLGRGAGLNLGRGAVFGTSKLGASGIAGLLAGKGAMIAAAAVAMVAGGVYLATYSPSVRPSDAFSSSVSPSNYVPAILRSQAANQGSSLEMFKDTNKGKLATEAPPPAEEEAKDAEPAAGAPEGEPQVSGAEMDPAAAMMEKLKGGIDMNSLTTQLGGGDGKFSGMGGFNNKFNEGAVGSKTGFSKGVGSGGFSAMPKFDSRKQKMLAMKGASRPVFGAGQASKKVKIGSGSYGQAKGVRNIQKSYSGSSSDGARATQDKAWEGTTADGSAGSGVGGAGLGAGGAGIVSSPSLDNVSGVSGGGVSDEGEVPDGSDAQNVSPWQNLIQMAMMLIMFSAMLSAAGSMLIKVGRALMACPFTFAIGLAMYLAGVAMCLMAIAMGVAAIMMGMKVMSAEGQSMLGMVYMLGGGVAVAAGVMGLTGANMGAITPIWMSAIAGIIAMMGSMFAGKFNPPTGM